MGKVTRAGFDVIVVGAGIAGMSVAVESVRSGLRTLLVEKETSVGGVLHVSSGQLSAGGTAIQRTKGISDTADEHLADIRRISTPGTYDEQLVDIAVREAATSVDWLIDNGFDLADECPAFYHFHEAYSKPRTYWGKNGGRSLLDFFERQLDQARESGLLELRVETAVTEFSTTDPVEVVLTSGETLEAGALVLASGGYLGDPALIRRFTTEKSVLSAGWAPSTGAVLGLLADKGFAFNGLGQFVPTFGGIEEEMGSGRAVRARIPNFVTQDRKPWEIYVDTSGRRFLREDSESVDYREKALHALDEMAFWVVFDERILQEAPALLHRWDPAEVDGLWNTHPSFVRAHNVEQLAEQMGVPPEQFRSTVDSYNASVDANRDLDGFGREFFPSRLGDGDYYAVRNQASLVKSFAGVRVDTSLRVLDEDGSPASRVFAVGEVLGGHALAGDAFLGGMSLTPAISLGRILGRDILPEE